MEETSALYVRGFNHGYTLAKDIPDLVAKIVKQLSPENDYLSGFFSGKEEWELEQNRIRLDELKQLRNQSKERGYDLEKE
jgi:hypothetical protein